MSKKSKTEDFVHLHTHSDHSQLDGCGKISEYVKVAKERGNPALAFTEHGSMRGYLQLQKEAQKQDVKPIYGIEFYVSPDMHRKGLTAEEKEDVTKGLGKSEHRGALKEYEEREGIRDRWHTTVWAMDDEGMQNLQRLSSAAYIDGFYYKPRVDLKALCENNEGLAVSTGCLSSPVNDMFLQGKKRAAFRFVDEMHDAFGDRMFLELQPHAIGAQAKTNRFAMKLQDRIGAKFLATQDAHYVHEGDHEAHELLLCIGTGAKMTDPGRFKFDGDEFYFRTPRQKRDAFLRHHDFLGKGRIKEALDSTVELASRCNVDIEIDYLKALLPNPGMPAKYEGDDFRYLKDLCLDGWTWRQIPQRARAYAAKHGISSDVSIKLYMDRLKMELRALKKQRFVMYFLVVRDVYAFARGAKIMCGPGRGSAGGSLVSFLLGITAVDPIEHGLLFERFINPDRADLPDVDMDFEDARRPEVIEYLVRKYGQENVCQIATIGKLSGKQCLRDVSRVLGVPLPEVNEIAPSIIDRPDGHPRQYNTIEDSFKEFDVCRDFSERHPDVLKHSKTLEGMAKTLGIHAAGVVASPVPLTQIIPLEIRKHKGNDVVVSAVNMNEIASVGLVKLDVLGLRTLTVIKDALQGVKERHGKEIDMERIDMEDPKVLQAFTDHDFGGVFQYDTPSAYKICDGVEFEAFEDISTMTALNRPGATRSGLAEKYLARKKDPKKRDTVDYHPEVNRICADTLGVIVYQEHCIKMFTELAGISPGDADSLRKAIGKKKAEVLKAARTEFVEGCGKKHGISEGVANKIFSAIEAFGAYGFNKSHATEYAAIAYWCQYLKAYYPVEFYWALLKNEPDHASLKAIAKGAKKKGIHLLAPSVSYSRDVFSIDPDGNVRGSLVDIKGVGAGAAQTVMENQPFRSFIDFAQKIDRRRCNRGVVVALLRAGAMKGMVPNQKYFEEHLDVLWKALTRKRGKAEAVKQFWEDARAAEDHTEEERLLVAAKVNPLAFGEHPLEAYDSFMKEYVNVPLSKVDDSFWSTMDGKPVYVAGLMLDTRSHQIGDFHTGDLPSKSERRKQFWGSRYGNVNMEGSAGGKYRIRFDIDIYEDHRDIMDADTGTPIVVHATVDAKYERLKAHFAINLEDYRAGVRAGNTDTNLWERIVSGNHPSSEYPWKSEKVADKLRFNTKFFSRKAGGTFTGVVTHVRLKFDKSGRPMAFFGLLGERGYVDVICFSSVWETVHKVIRRGRLVSMPIDRVKDEERGIAYLFNGGRVRHLKKSSAADGRGK